MSEQDVANIHSFMALHEKNALASEWNAEALLYTQDAIRFPPEGSPIKGIGAINQI